MTLGIIIPNYNKSKYLSNAIQSIMQQTLIPDEIWIVDDCSTDDSRMIIDNLKLSNPRIKTIYFEKNQGVSCARNAGILAATTEYITTLDSDDFIFDKNKLENEMACIKKAESAGKEHVFAYSKTVYVDESGQVVPGHKHNDYVYLKGKIQIPLLANYHFLDTVPRDYCIKKEYMLEAGLYDENSRYFEDLDLLYRVIDKCEALFTKCDGVGYRHVSGGLSQQGRDRLNTTLKCLRKKYYVNLLPVEKIRYYLLWVLGKARKVTRKMVRAFEKLLLGKA